MRADAVGIEAVEHLRDGLQVGNVLLADLPALLDGGDQFAHVGGQLRDALRVKVELQYAFYLGRSVVSPPNPAQNLSQPPKSFVLL